MKAGHGKSEMGMEQLEFSKSFLLLKLYLELCFPELLWGLGSYVTSHNCLKYF